MFVTPLYHQLQIFGKYIEYVTKGSLVKRHPSYSFKSVEYTV